MTGRVPPRNRGRIRIPDTDSILTQPGAPGIPIAVLDSGVRANHPDLRGRVAGFQNEINQRGFYAQWGRMLDGVEPDVPGANA